MTAPRLSAVWWLMLRRDRVRSAVWIGFLVLFVVSTVKGMASLLPTQAERDAFAAGVAASPVQLAYLGPVFANTIPGLTAWRTSFFAIVAGVFGMLTLTRHTRALEEDGALELTLAQPVGRVWLWRSAVAWSMLTLLLLGMLDALVMIGQQAPLVDSLLYGASFALDGWVMIGVTAVCAQLSTSTRTVHVWGSMLLLLGFFANAYGRLTDSWSVWVAPVFWVQRTQPFAGNHWWVIAVGVAVNGVLVALGDALLQRRDYGAGLIAARPGRASATPMLLGAWRFWWYRVRGTVLIALGSALLLGLLTVGLGQSIESQFETSPKLVAVLQMLGGSSKLFEAYLSFMAFIAAGFAMGMGIQLISLLQRDESAGLLEPLLAGTWSRGRLFAAVVTTAGVVGALMLLIYALVIGNWAKPTAVDLQTAVWGAVVQFPAIDFAIAMATAVLVWAPRVLGILWIWLTLEMAMTVFNDIWKLPDAVLQFLPLTHTPLVLVGQNAGTYPLIVEAAACILYALSWWGWQRRDIAISDE